MASESKVYIAGTGLSALPAEYTVDAIFACLVSAATKALLDAGITHDDVSRSVTVSHTGSYHPGSEAARAFDKGVLAVDEIASGSGLDYSLHLVKNQSVQSVLLIALDKVCVRDILKA